jgi:hypothetical protein
LRFPRRGRVEPVAVVAVARGVDDFEPALADLIARGAKALLVGSQPFFIDRRAALIPLITWVRQCTNRASSRRTAG